MTRTVINAPAAPKAIGPYSHAIEVPGFVFCSGQTGIDPATGELVSGDVGEQTHRTLQNLRFVLEQAGSSLAQVVKTTVFLMDMQDFSVMNGIYAEYFSSSPPARSTVQVAGLPKGARVEIEAVAVKG